MTSIILPFYIKKINNLLLHDKEQSTYSGDAELSYEGDGVYSVIDILGNTLLLDIAKQAY